MPSSIIALLPKTYLWDSHLTPDESKRRVHALQDQSEEGSKTKVSISKSILSDEGIRRIPEQDEGNMVADPYIGAPGYRRLRPITSLDGSQVRMPRIRR
jgi:hypothetical protein